MNNKMPGKCRFAALITALVLGTGAAGIADAATAVTYTYAGVVNFCDDVALGGGICGVLVNVGDTIGGDVLIDAPDGVSNQVFTPDDVIDYAVGVNSGAIGATPENSTLDPASFLATNADGLAVDGLFSILVDPLLLPVAINADLSTGTWELLVFPGALDLLLVGGTGGFGPPTVVPLPPALWLLAGSLLSLTRWRRAG